MPTKLLFVCSRARRRSATAEAIFGQLDGIDTMDDTLIRLLRERVGHHLPHTLGKSVGS